MLGARFLDEDAFTFGPPARYSFAALCGDDSCCVRVGNVIHIEWIVPYAKMKHTASDTGGTMVDHQFKLPISSYDEVCKIIKAYATLGKLWN